MRGEFTVLSRNRECRSRLGFLLACSLVIGCPSSPPAGDGTDGAPGDADDAFEIGDGSDEAPGDGVPSYDAGVEVYFPPVEEVPGCGNGVLEAGEECDDRNRLNGDGCDWECRLGDGDPPPPPDPTVPDYVPATEPALLPTAAGLVPNQADLPLLWTGSSFALTYLVNPEGSGPGIRFGRYTRTGSHLGPEWSYSNCAEGADYCWSHDLVWTGTGFGLFYVDGRNGIIFQALEADGKPLGPAMVVEADPFVVALAADRTEAGFLLAWVVESDPGTPLSWTPCATPGLFRDDRIRLRRVGFDGTTSGPPIELESRAQGRVDIAVGAAGVGLLVTVNGAPATTETLGNCAVRFARLDAELAHETYSGVLAPGDAGQVRWVDDHYVVAFCGLDWSGSEPRGTDFCVARYRSGGDLERAPVCTRNPTMVAHGMHQPRFGAGDGGLILLASWGPDDSLEPYSYYLQYLRTDAIGVAVGPVHDVVPPPHNRFGAYAAAWSEDGFGVAWYGGGSEGLSLRSFVAE